MAPKTVRRRVALIIETLLLTAEASSPASPKCICNKSGIGRYFSNNEILKRRPPAWLANWDGDGIISRSTTRALAKAAQRNRIPLIELTDRHTERVPAHVRSDDDAIGRLAAEHLLDRGFRHFGYCGYLNEAWSERRLIGFRHSIREDRAPVAVYSSSWHGSKTLSWEEESKRLARWLKSLPLPVGIMTCNDIRGRQILDACTHLGLAVPEEVAVIGVDNDEILCRLSNPPLSSVIPDVKAIGYQAAELLARAMNGSPGTIARDHLLPPIGIATRQSSDIVAIEDTAVAAALRFIRESACQGITVNDVVKQVGRSRSTLERRMRQTLGRSPQQEIRLMQIKRAKELLLTSDLTVHRIAELCGFENPEYLHVMFRREVGQTPGEFRQRGTSLPC
ncbi:MAG: DNA-binding transcriptional regulator [Planctomycetota bacterium]